jgi:F-type H+-transporting ATPase subunit epsilon
MTNKFLFRIISADGKVFSDSIDELYVDTGDHIEGVLANHYPMVCKVAISSFKIKKDGVTKYFAISGGILNVEKNTVYILADTFEDTSELDKDRIFAAKKRAEEALATFSKEDEDKIREAEFSLKKALNRLRLIK